MSKHDRARVHWWLDSLGRHLKRLDAQVGRDLSDPQMAAETLNVTQLALHAMVRTVEEMQMEIEHLDAEGGVRR